MLVFCSQSALRPRVKTWVGWQIHLTDPAEPASTFWRCALHVISIFGEQTCVIGSYEELSNFGTAYTPVTRYSPGNLGTIITSSRSYTF